jgi:hypothetical protein
LVSGSGFKEKQNLRLAIRTALAPDDQRQGSLGIPAINTRFCVGAATGGRPAIEKCLFVAKVCS